MDILFIYIKVRQFWNFGTFEILKLFLFFKYKRHVISNNTIS